ncbi:DUF5930 domain-containing protein [Rhabdonatronobacter sediminivivens]|uniref:DUF5930 domain-containing protein n=1 Tax=Rhabdonatronobacter sediminivivens TaxID=2743469 RepID=UPI001F227CAE|nr:DUF5930 domain-containing protein [Rhabdonatronobacter sediminivivens]
MSDRLNGRLEPILPEKRLFLRADDKTRFVRLRPLTQATMIGGTVAFVAWSMIATAILLMSSIGSGNLRDQVAREQANYEARLDAMAQQRDARAAEADAAHDRFSQAMQRVSEMQSSLLASEERRMELEAGIETVQRTLRRALRDRDEAREQLAALTQVQAEENGGSRTALDLARDADDMVGFLLTALENTALERDASDHMADQYRQQAEHMAMETRLMAERNNRIFEQLEEAVELSMVPLERVFRNAGVSTQQILSAVRSGASADAPALRPISVSTSGSLDPDSDEARANSVLAGLDKLNRYRIGVGRLPVSRPVVSGNVRQTSGFGPRRHPLTGRNRMHNGLDWAGPRGTPIHATADGVVTQAGRQGGYGNLVIIRHDFGIETYYAHLNSVNVRAGQRVSRGDRIGGMGTTGQSTGVHLHYEVRVGGTPVNPITYIRAGQHVF